LLHDILDQFLSGHVGNLSGEQALFRQHDHAVPRGPDFQRAPLAQKSNGWSFQGLNQQTEGSMAAPCSSLLFGAQAMVREANIKRLISLWRRPKFSIACAKRDGFERFDGFPTDSRRVAPNCRNASAVTAAKCGGLLRQRRRRHRPRSARAE
jgi:hypothetical protein